MRATLPNKKGSDHQLSDVMTRQNLTEVGPYLAVVVVLTTAVVAGALAAQQPVWAVAAALLMPLALMLIVWPHAPTLAVLFILYTNAAVVAVKFHNVPYIIGASVPVLLLVPLAHFLVVRRQKLVFTSAMPFLFLFLIVQIFGTLLAKDASIALPNLVEFVLEGIGLYFIITNVVRSKTSLRYGIWAILIGGALIGGIVFYQQVTGTFNNNYGGFAQVSNAAFSTGEQTLQGEVEQPRLAGSVGEQNRHAQVMLMLVPLGLFRIWGERSKKLRMVALACTILVTFGFVLAFSRGAALAFIAMLVAMTFMRYISLRQFVLILLGFWVLTQLFPQYGTRALKLQGLLGLVSPDANSGATAADGSLEGRATEMLTAALVFADHPVFGVGPGMYRYHYQDYAKLVGPRWQQGNRQAHNLYLGIAADTGALGFIAFLAIMFVTIRDLLRIRKRGEDQPELANMATALILAIITYLVSGVGLHFAYIRYFWLIMGLAGAISYVASIEKPDSVKEATLSTPHRRIAH